MKLKLPTVTLICVDCVNPELSLKVLDICKSKADFGAVKLLTHLPIESEHRVEITPLTTLVMYSVFCLTKLHEYIDTPNVLIVQADGFILNPESFNPEWLDLDYVAPLFIQYDVVGSGGFSLRSKRIMEYASHIFPNWDKSETHANKLQKGFGYYEDGVLCMNPKFKHFKFATKEQAADFGQGGNKNPEYFREKPFGFHRTWQQIDFRTGMIDSSDTSKTLNASYEHEILKLTE